MTLLLALLLDAAMGEPRWLWSRLPHPAVLAGNAVGWLDARLNRGAARRLKGVLAVALLVLGAVIIGIALAALGPVAEIIVAAVLLAQRSLVDHVRAVADALRMSVTEGRRAVAMIVGRDTADMDGTAIARAAIESAAENFSDGVVAPAFWFAVGGLPGILVYKVVNTADSMIGYRTPRHESFGWAAARLDDMLNLVPARLTALLIWLLSGAPLSWRSALPEARAHRSPNAGWPEAVMARALDVALSGPRSYNGEMRPFPWVHPAGQKFPGPEQIDAAVAMLWRAWAVGLAGAVCIVTFLN